MSINTTTRLAGPYAGNGVQTVFAYAFKVFATSDLVVARADSTGAETTLTLGVDYTATMNVDQDAAPGGNVTLGAALANGYTLTITSEVPLLQAVVVTNAGGFFPSVFNGVFDRLTIFAQQLAEKLNRSIKFTKASALAGSALTPIAGGYVRMNAGNTALEIVSKNTAAADLGIAVDPATYASAIATAEAYADTNKLSKAANLSDVADVPTARGNLGFVSGLNALWTAATAALARTALGLGTAAVTNTGTGVGNVLAFAVSGQLPAVDGSQLTGLSFGPNATIQMFGDGSDGNVTISSGTTTLARDMYYNNLTLSGAGKLNTNGWRIFVAGTLDLSAAGVAAIFNNGGNGATATSGVAFAGGTAAPGNTVGAGAAGVASTTGAGIGSGRPANAGLPANNGGVGGAGGAGAQQTGGSGGATAAGGTTTPTAIHRAVTALTPSDFSVTLLLGGASGASGGGGAGDGSGTAGYSGGGSGAGGGVVAIFARIINRGVSTPASCIQAKGGDGGGGGNGSGVGGGGGAGGGGGGWVYIICNSLIGTSAANAVDVTGGNGGAGGTNAVTNGSDGGGTGAGGRFTLGVYSTSTMTDTLSGAAAKAPSAHVGTTPGGAQTANVAQFSL